MTEEERELIQLKADIYDWLVLRHPGHGNQKVHGNRFGSYSAAKESLRRLKDDKEGREKYKESARSKRDAGQKSSVKKSVEQGYNNSKSQVLNAKEYHTGNPAFSGGKTLPEPINKQKAASLVDAELEKMGKAGLNRYTGRNNNKPVTKVEADKISSSIGDSLGFNAGIYEAFGKSTGDIVSPSEASNIIFDKLKSHNKSSKSKTNMFGEIVSEDLF